MDKKKLRTWQNRLGTNESAYASELSQMDDREEIYSGDKRDIKALTINGHKASAPHIRNIAAEIIEAEINSSIPQPKVTARRKEDEAKAKLIEDMIRNELDRMPFELINDMMERTVPIQGGAAFLLEWDNTEKTHYTVGELTCTAIHPKQIIPQDGVYTGIEDMDYIILKLPQTKEYIKRRYNVEVIDEGEEEPDIKGSDKAPADDLVTQYVAYYRNENGGVGIYSWAHDTELEDIEDYQARRVKKCKRCGAPEPSETETITQLKIDGNIAEDAEIIKTNKHVCPYCGSTKFEYGEDDYQDVYTPIVRSDGSVIPGAVPEEVISEEVDENGLQIVETIMRPTKIPYYKPDIYPIILQKNISVYGKFLGDSDVDKIADQQNTTNRIEKKIIDKLLKSGSYMTLPDDATIKYDEEDMKIIRPGNAASKALIDVYDMQGNIQQDLAYLSYVYEESRQIIGITDAFQGRADRTATSAKAKEFSAAQSAGRLESKKTMKNAAYASLFEAMFKFKLAYADEPRPVVSNDIYGNPEYSEFNRYDFLEMDEAGEWCWNDQFIFSCDSTAPLASNREAMWQETRMNLQTGAFGDPTDLNTLILFWAKMEALHYPTAAETKRYLEERLEEQMAQAQQARQMQAEAIIEQARQDASQTAMQRANP